MKTTKFPLRLAATIFGIIALLHLARMITGLSLVIGDWAVPLWVNGVGLVLCAGLGVWFWRMGK